MYKLGLLLLLCLHVSRSIQAECTLPEALAKEIQSYEPIVQKILQAGTKGSYSGRPYDDLAKYVDKFGNRLAGTDNLEAAIDDVLKRMQNAGLEVSEDFAEIPTWLRGEESLELVTPRKAQLNVLGLGLSVGTPVNGTTAEILVVKDFDELETLAAQVPGKIVVFNSEFVTYGVSQRYRTRGPFEASKKGAVAALVRSLTPFSIDSTHTGATEFDGDVTPIPAAAITLEDADMLARMVQAGERVTITLKMGATRGKDRTSRNAIGDLKGATNPGEYVVLSGHIDSWDVGQGAMDDAGGAFISWHALSLIKSLDLPPTKRTIRAILWTAEEQGIIGAKAYLKNRPEEVKSWSAAFESDGGVFESLGYSFAGSDDATCIMRAISSLFGSINATEVEAVSAAGSDIGVFSDSGVPLGEPKMVENHYFWFHHSKGDSMRVLNTKDLDQNTAMFAATSYVLANLSILLPRQNTIN